MTAGTCFVIKSTQPNIPEQEVRFDGIQEGSKNIPDFGLYTLTKDIVKDGRRKHSSGSTISKMTLEQYGYVFPSEAK